MIKTKQIKNHNKSQQKSKMNKRFYFKLFALTFFSFLINSIKAQEQIIPLTYNKSIITNNVAYSLQNSNPTQRIANANYPTYYYFQQDTLTLPFIDDFSINTTFESRIHLYNLASQQNTFPNYNFKVNNSYQNSFSFVVDTAFTFNIIANQIVKTALPPIQLDSFIVKFDYPLNQPYRSYIVWPSYYTFNFDTIAGIIIKADSTLNVDYTWVLDTFNIYVTNMAGRKGNFLDNKVYVNNTFAKNPITQGVATFDGINENGLPYNNFINPNAYGLADVLTSKRINLNVSNGIADSVYFSFFYQLKGFGNAPNALSDSLVLEFKSPMDTNWSFIWKKEPPTVINDSAFIWVNIPIIQSKFLKNGFQFRFKAYGTLSGAFDHWHIDYIYLNKDRTSNDNFQRDVAFIKTTESLIQNFYAMPYKQFSKSLLKPNLSNTVRNFFTNELQITNRFQVTDNFNTLLYAPLLSNINIGVGVNTAPTIGTAIGFNRLLNPPLDSINKYLPDSQVCKFYNVRQVISINSGGADVQKTNDTLTFKQYIANFYALDDGSAEAGYKLVQNPFVPDGRVAYKIFLPNTDVITAMRFYFLPQEIDARPESFLLTIWEDDGTGKPGAVKYVAPSGVNPIYGLATNFYHEYNVPNISLDGNKLWFFGFQQTSVTNLNLGLDLNTINNSNMYYNVGNGWFQSLIKASFMIRPVFGTCPFETGSVNNLIDKYSIKNCSISPNPASTKISIESDFEIGKIEAYNILGQTQYFTINSNVIDVSNWANGLYVINVTTSNAISTHRIVINHD